VFDTRSDAELIRLILDGQSELFRHLIERYAKELQSFCMARLRDADEAADAIQDIFIKAYRSLSSFDTKRAFRPWLYSICLNHLKNRYWQRSRQQDLSARLQQAALVQADNSQHLAGPEELALRTMAIEELLEAMIRLPAKYRQVVELYYFAGLDIAETAQALQLTAPAVKTRLFRARSLLEKKIALK